MEEKERYKWSQDAIEECAYEDYDYIVDTENNIIFDDDNYFKLVDLLNQKDKRIKKLEEQEETYAKFSSYQFEENKLRYNKLNKELTEQVQELKQQLHDLPKKIVEDFYDEIRHRAILEDDYCPDHNFERKYGVRKCLLENIRTTILKKYGGENDL